MRDRRRTGQAGGATSLAVAAWALYDFAATIFSVSMLAFFFPLWLGDELGAGADLFNYVVAASMSLVVLTAPVLGALADFRQRRKPFLVGFTLLAIACTAALDAFGAVIPAVALFVAGNYGFQSAQIFYNSLLPGVAGERGAGRVSGYGVAAGYVGTILVLVSFTYLVTNPEGVRSFLGPLGWWIETEGALNSNAFVPTAVLYLVFSLPAFFLVPDRRVRPPRPVGILEGYRNVLKTAREIRRYPGMGVFILSTILYTDTANTVTTNMSLYGRVVFGMEQEEIRNLLLFSTVFAAAGAVGSGFVADRIGPKATLVAVIITWLVAVSLATVVAEAWMLLFVGPIVGIALGSTWVVSRVMLVALSPPEKMGEFFGFYSLAGRFSAVTGPALAGIILTVFSALGPAAYRLAVFSLAVTLSISLWLLLRVPDVRPGRTTRQFSS